MDGDSSEKLNEILSDPEKLSQIMSIVKTVMGNNENTQEKNNDRSDAEEVFRQSEPPPPPLPPKPKPSPQKDKRVALLLALKPYLNHKRQDKVDKLMKIFQLGEFAGIFKNYL